MNKAYVLVTQEERHKTIIRSRDDRTEVLSLSAQSCCDSTTVLERPPCTHCGNPVMIMITATKESGIHWGDVIRVAAEATTDEDLHLGIQAEDVVRTLLPMQARSTAHNSDSVQQSAATSAPLFTAEQFQRLLSLIDSSVPPLKSSQDHITRIPIGVGKLRNGVGCITMSQ